MLISSTAGQTRDRRTVNSMVWSNIAFTHWRGEIVKSQDLSTNGNLSMLHCTFADGNATAINIYAALDVNGCTFSNLFQIGEYYQAYSTNTSYLRNCFVTNIVGNAWAWNGATGINPPFIMQSNTFYFNGSGNNGLQPTPGVNIQILDNHIFCPASFNAIVLGTPGYQGSFCNSNILISRNTLGCVNPAGDTLTAFVTYGAGSPNNVKDVTIISNVYSGTFTIKTLFTYSTSSNDYSNIRFAYNNLGSVVGDFQTSAGGTAPYVLIETNNTMTGLPESFGDGTAITISPNTGVKYDVNYVQSDNAAYFTCADAASNSIPAGAWMEVDNTLTNSFGHNLNYYLSQNGGSPVYSLAKGAILTVWWNKPAGIWQTNAP